MFSLENFVDLRQRMGELNPEQRAVGIGLDLVPHLVLHLVRGRIV